VTRRIRIASVGDLSPGTAIMIASDVTGTPDDIALVCDVDGSLHALDDTCPHFLASLARGRVLDGCVECPVHSARFDLRTGREMSGAFAASAVVHGVEVLGTDIVLVVDED
jgi:3-phenylpropionate/trans-cinnamate dioxygenase ferredoxin subunit